MATNQKRLSPQSEYEQMFKTRHRRAGRPPAAAASGLDENRGVLFDGSDSDPILVRVAQRRSFAIVHEENRERLAQLFKAELKVLRRRGVAEVAADAGISLQTVEDIENERVGTVAEAKSSRISSAEAN